MNAEIIYQGIKKSVKNDFPYDIDWNDGLVFPVFQDCYNDVVDQHSRINNSYYSDNVNGIIRLEYVDHYVIICYRFAKSLISAGLKNIADAVYYSYRIRGSIDLFYTTEIGECFMPVHALGTVIDSHSKYGKYFKIYDGCHIGPFSIVGKEAKDWVHPQFGDFVTMLGHSKVFGKTSVGNNVIISVGSMIVNEEIPDNCIVSGSSPNLVYQKLKISNDSIVKG